MAWHCAELTHTLYTPDVDTLTGDYDPYWDVGGDTVSKAPDNILNLLSSFVTFPRCMTVINILG